MRLQCVSVATNYAESAIRNLRSAGLLANAKPLRKGANVEIPVTDVARASQLLESLGIRHEACADDFEARARAPRLSELTGLSGFLKIGPIIIFNHSRGVPLDKYVVAAEEVARAYKDVRSVFLKLGTTGELRLPQLVLIYGDGSTEAEVKENGLRFRLDVSRVYYNPRLSGERARVAGLARDGERVLDMFSGVAPFSITIASRARAHVLSVDLNPYATYYASLNVEANRKRLKGDVEVLRADARRLPEIVDESFDRIIMNNPTASTDFLDVACGLASRGASIHVYVLSASEELAVSRVLGSRCARKLAVVGHRRVLEYSPSSSVYVVDLEVLS